MSKFSEKFPDIFPVAGTYSSVLPLFNPAIIIHHSPRNYAGGVAAFILLFHLSVASPLFIF